MTEEVENSRSPTPDRKDMKVSSWTICFTIVGIIFYIADVTFDIMAANRHFYDGHMFYFGLTVGFIALPAVFMAGFSLKMYSDDTKKFEKDWKKFDDSPSNKRCIFRGLTIMVLAPVLRNFEALYYAYKYWKSSSPEIKQYYARRCIRENFNAAFLRLLEASMECGPQIILRIYIISISQNQSSETETTQLSIVISLLSMSYTIIAYGRNLRSSLDDKRELPWYFCGLPWIWRVCEISSRCLALGLFASVYPITFCVVFMIHFMCMTMWIGSMNTEFYGYDRCPFRCGEDFYNIMMGVILTYCYFPANPINSPSICRIIFFYSCIFVENTILMVVWYHYDLYFDSTKIGFAFNLQLVLFFLSIVFMVLYYYCHHPTVGKCFKESTSRHHSANNADISGNEIVLLERVVSEYQNDEIDGNSKSLTHNGFCENSKKRKEYGVQ